MIKATKWRDEHGNVYSVEKAVRNGRFGVIRTNPGGQAVKRLPAGGAAHVQRELNGHAQANGWTEGAL